MLTKMKTDIKGRLRNVKSHLRRSPVRVEQLEHYPDRGDSRFASWLEQIGDGGVSYHHRWSHVEHIREQLIDRHGESLDDSLAQNFFGPDARLEYIHVNARGGQFLASVVRQFTHPTVIEFGTAFGLSGMYLLTTIGQGKMVTFDPCQDWKEVAMRNLSTVHSNFVRIPETFEDGFPKIADTLEPISVAFVDGLHTYENVTREVAMLEPYMPEGSVMILHDVELDDEMRRGWAEIKDRPRVVCSAFVERQFGVIELGAMS